MNVLARRKRLEEMRGTHPFGGDNRMWDIVVNQEIQMISPPKSSAASVLTDPSMSLEDAMAAKILFELVSLVGHYISEGVEKLRSTYGNPLSPTSARIEFWPAKEDEYPLLFSCVIQMLPAPATTCNNERSHVPAARLCSKVRAAIKPDTVTKLTLAYFSLRQRASEVNFPPEKSIS